DQKLNPLNGIAITSKFMKLVDQTSGIQVTFEFSSDIKIWVNEYATFSRMNTDDYQSKYQGIELAFISTTPNLTIMMNINRSRPNENQKLK
ncbi:MAG: hypothetical protein ACTSWN_15105, partial [Promethearchaeota archaeon]